MTSDRDDFHRTCPSYVIVSGPPLPTGDVDRLRAGDRLLWLGVRTDAVAWPRTHHSRRLRSLLPPAR
eukprot:747942-Hanusia_phi.AAC.1